MYCACPHVHCTMYNLHKDMKSVKHANANFVLKTFQRIEAHLYNPMQFWVFETEMALIDQTYIPGKLSIEEGKDIMSVNWLRGKIHRYRSTQTEMKHREDIDEASTNIGKLNLKQLHLLHSALWVWKCSEWSLLYYFEPSFTSS